MAKKAGVLDLAHIDIGEKLPERAKRMAGVATSVYFEPYFAATSSGVGSLAARANSIDAGLAYCKKVKEATASSVNVEK